MRYYGLIGHPLSHSFSKAYFDNKFKNEDLDCFFVNFDIEKLDSIKDIILNYPDLKGFTITHPYKKEIFHFLDLVDDNAKEIGAVNVVKIENDKKLHGFNTDYIGFQGLLDEATRNMCIKSAYVCGTGGAADAVNYVLRKKGIEIKTLSRKDDSYQRLKKDGFNSNELIINATPVGMYPNSDGMLDLPYDTVNETNVFIDLIYNPEETMFMRDAKKYGANVYNGLKMLKLQAEAAWKIWSL